jgi:hypothetical protein
MSRDCYAASPLALWLLHSNGLGMDLQKTRYVTAALCCGVTSRCMPKLRGHKENTAAALLAACVLWALPSNGFTCHNTFNLFTTALFKNLLFSYAMYGNFILSSYFKLRYLKFHKTAVIVIRLTWCSTGCFIKGYSESVEPLLKSIFKLSLSQSTFLKLWKQAVIVPFLKKKIPVLEILGPFNSFPKASEFITHDHFSHFCNLN